MVENKVEKKEISFWQFLGLISLLISIFGAYLPESKRIGLFYVLFAGVFIYSFYNIYNLNNQMLDHKEIKKGSDKYFTYSLSIELLQVFFYSSFLYSFVSYMITLPKSDFSIISALFLASLILLFRSSSKSFNLKKPYSYDLSLLFSLCFIFIITLVSFAFRNSSNLILYTFSYLSAFSISIFKFLMIDFTIQILKILHNKEKFKFFDFKNNIKLKKSDFLLTSGLILFILFVMIFMLFVPQIDNPKSLDYTNCSIVKKYDIYPQNNFFGVYKKYISYNENTTINITLNAILQDDGSYQSLDIESYTKDLSYLQYFEYKVLNDEKLNSLVFMFKDKNIKYFDYIEITKEINNCINKST